MSIVIVGAGLAGGTAATELREQGYDGPVVLVGAEEHAPYERPPLSKGYLLGNDPIDDAFVHPLDWYAEHDVDLRLGRRGHRGRHRRPRGAHRDRRAVTYERLLLATGAEPRRLAVAEDSGVPDGLPAHHRGQRPAQGGLRRRAAGSRSSAPAGSAWRPPRPRARPGAT